MRFLKEIIAIIIIMGLLIISELYISSVTNKSIEEAEGKISYLMENILNENNYIKEEEIKKIEAFENEWKEIENKLAYFTEHDELEKVSVIIPLIKANVEADLRQDAYEKMHEIKFRIEHIKTKQKFELNNFF